MVKKTTIGKRGELTTQQIVILILLITSFIVLLFLLWRLNLGEISDKEICHNSVVLKSQSSLKTGALNCRTNYVCISGGDECEEFNPTVTVEIDANDKEQIMKALADEMADCWWMFGEGKINYGEGFASKSVHCAICSIIKFDEKIQDEIPEITYSEFYDYLSKNKKDETQTYLKYLYGINDLSLFESQSHFNVDITKDVILTQNKYSVVTGIDNNLIGGDEFLKTYLIASKDTPKTECDNFITKA